MTLTLWVTPSRFESDPIRRHAEIGAHLHSFMRRGLTLAATIAALVLLLPTSSLAATTINDPIFNVDDWFEYEGYTDELVFSLAAQWDSDDDFEGLSVTDQNMMRVTQLGNENCRILDWDGGCIKAQLTYLVNMTLNWQENTTQYVNDTLNMSISYDAIHYKANSNAGWEKLDATTLTETRFSGGGEDNLLEQESRVITLTERVGDWPNKIGINSTWDIEETQTISTTTKTRENRGLWSESVSNFSRTEQVVYRATGESLVHYGVANERDHDTLVIERTYLTENITHRDYFRSEGFLARTETWDDGNLVLSATLVDYRYYETEPHSYTSSSNWLLPALFVGLLTLGVIGAGAAYFTLSNVPSPQTLLARSSEDDSEDSEDENLDDEDIEKEDFDEEEFDEKEFEIDD
jgi:hypothetical protein